MGLFPWAQQQNGKIKDAQTCIVAKHLHFAGGFLQILEDTARYAGLLFWPIFGIFWCPVVTLVTFSSNLSNFERNPKKPKEKKEKKI